MSQLISIDWEAEDLTGVEASVNDGDVRIRRCFNLAWPEHIRPEESIQQAGEWLASSLREVGVSTHQALVVLPRETVVVRRLDLPHGPEDELPDLVRFQAATKSSTPLDKLALDYIPLPVAPEAPDRQVLMVTVDSRRMQMIRQVLAAAGLELHGIGISSVALAELAIRIVREHSTNPLHATLVVYQEAHRVEITILQQRCVVFTHQTRLSGSDDASGIRSSIVEINRASVALSQSQHDVEIREVCLVHAGDADPALEEALSARFGGRLHVLDVAEARGLRCENRADRAAIASFAPAVGMLFSHDAAQVPAIDFLHPRKREEAPDRTKLKWGLAAAGLVLAAGVGYGAFRWHLSGLNEQIALAESQEGELQRTLKTGAPQLEAAGSIQDWLDGGRDPLGVLNELRGLGPGTGRLYLKEYEQIGGSRDTVARITGLGYSRTREDVEDLQETLERAGYRVLPNVTTPSRVDPDYPFEFQLELHILHTEAKAHGTAKS